MAYFMGFNQFKGYSSCINEASMMRLDMHQQIIHIYIYFKFHENLFSGYLFMSNFIDSKSIQGLQLSCITEAKNDET